MEASGRLERASTVEGINFFPSVSLGYNLTNNLIESEILSFAKLRGSFGQIGIEPLLYQNKDIFLSSNAGSPNGWGDIIEGANYGGAIRRGTTRGNPDLTIEKVREFEVGGDFRFFNNKFNLGLTYYNRFPPWKSKKNRRGKRIWRQSERYSVFF